LNPRLVIPNLYLSLRVVQTRAAFSVTQTILPERAAPQLPMLKKVDMSPDDEILLTELAFDTKDIIAYEINSIILVAEREQANPHGKFRCYMDPTKKEFFIEIATEGTMTAFTQSALLNILELAEEAGAETCYVCVRRTVKGQEGYLRNFLFIGFEKLTEEEQRKISMTKTHGIMKCSLKGEDDDF